MTRINFDDISGNEFAVNYNWNLRVVSLPTPVQALASASGLVFTGESGVLNLNCTTSALPNASNNVAEVMIRGHKVKQGTNFEFDGEINLNFAERKDWKGSKFWENWKELPFNHVSGLGAPKADYVVRQAFFLDLLDSQGVKTATYELRNAFPSNVTLPELTGEAGEIVRYDVTINYHIYNRTL